MSTLFYPARAAREAAGLSVEEAARLVSRSAPYLRRIERRGCAPEHISSRLAALYARHGAPCSSEVFLVPPSFVAAPIGATHTGATETPRAAGGVGDGSAAGLHATRSQPESNRSSRRNFREMRLINAKSRR